MSKLDKYEQALRRALRRSLRLSEQEFDEALSKGLIKLSDAYTGIEKGIKVKPDTIAVIPNNKSSWRDAEISIEDLDKTRQELLTPDYNEWIQDIDNTVLEDALIKSIKGPDEDREDSTVNICVEEG